MTKACLALARLSARLHLWLAAVFFSSVAFGRTGNFRSEESRFSYLLLMSRRHPAASRIFLRLLRQTLDRSAENNLWLARMAWYLNRPRLALLLYKRAERRFPGTPEAQIAASLRRFAEGIFSGALSADLDAALGSLPLPAPSGRMLALTVVSARFFDVFEIWLSQVRRHTSCFPLIVALDRQTADALRGRPDCGVIDASAWLRFDERNRLDRFSAKNLWVLRVLMLRVLLAHGYTVVSLDVDAIVVGDLDAMLRSFSAADIVAQRDYSIPMDVARRFGFILCCGFMAFRPGPPVLAFLDRYCEQTALELDDQLAVNHMLADSGITDRAETDVSLSFRSMAVSWLCPASSLVSREIGSGSVVRHFLLMDRSTADVRQSLGLTD